MPYFAVDVTRTQIQSVRFVVDAANQTDLVNQLNTIDFTAIDHCFDAGEVESIDYEVTNVQTSKQKSTSFYDNDLQDLLK